MSLGDILKKTWNAIPFGTKFILFVSILCYMMDYFYKEYYFQLFMNVPKKTIKKFQFWRILIPQFFHGNIYNLTISLLGFIYFAAQTEKRIGTVQFLVEILIKNIAIQIIYVSFCFGFSYLDFELIITNSFGFWNISFLYQMRRALNDEDEKITFRDYSYTFQQKYIPAIFFFLMNFLVFPRVDLVGATIFSFIENQYFEGFSFKLSDAFQLKFENSFLFRFFQDRQDFYNQALYNQPFDQNKQVSSLEFGIISNSEIKPKTEKQN